MSVEAYGRAADLGVVAAYFAPRASPARRARFERFAAPLRAGDAPFRVVELVLDGSAPELADSGDVVRIRGRDVLWQKERLLARAIAELPRSCTKVAWVDCDVLFDDPRWLVETSRALEDAQWVQPFSRVMLEAPGGARAVESYAAVLARDPAAHRGGNFDRHGHTGFAWATRRESLVAGGLYTRAIAGGADHAMAHAFAGEREGPCLDRVLGLGLLRADFDRWARRLPRSHELAIGCVEGDARHLFHGAHAERRYLERYEALHALDFDPARDLVADGDAWGWSAAADPRLGAFLRSYFAGRTSD